jgi:predicted glutamine amidotransferase
MCIICIKKKGVKFPSVEIVNTMCSSNPHGFSMVISDGRRARITKTLNRKKFIEYYKNAVKSYDYNTSAMFIHARIKTHGSERLENCHGWRENGLIFAHNGILSIQNRNDLTDSETFFRDIFSPAYKVGGWKLGEKTINAIIGTSKFVFMDDKGNIHHYGNYICDDGILYSNSTYISYKDRVEKLYPRSRYYYNYFDSDYRQEQYEQKEIDEWNRCIENDKYPF